MSSNLKVNTILPSTGTTVTVSGISSVTSSISAGSSITATTYYGSGANLTSLPSQVTINNASANRVFTSDGGTTLNGEANLTFDGSTLNNTNGGANFTKSSNNYILVGSTNASGASLVLDGDSNGDGSGTDYAYLTHNTDGDLDIVVDNPANAGNIKFFTNSSSERLRIDSSGRVMIGTTTEGNVNADDLTVATSGEGGITIRTGASSNGNIFFSDATSGAGEYAGIIDYKHSSNAMTFGTSGAERLRIDSSGNLFLRSATANYLVLGSSGDATSGGVTNNMNWIRGNQTNTQYNTAGGFHAFEISGTERFKIDANGYVYENAMPFGVLHGTTGWQYNNNGNGHYLLGNTSSSSGGGNGSDKQMNLGWTTSGGNGATNNNFTPSNGIWTAPIAGYYVFGLKLYGLMNSGDYIQIKPCLNGVHVSETIYGYQQGNGIYMEGINETVRYYMNANDTFSWNAYGPNNAWRIYGAHCETSGYLVRGS